MPTTGSASYTGGAVGWLVQPTSLNPNNAANYYGTMNLTANFATGAVSGAVTAIQLFTPTNNTTPMSGTSSDVMLAGTISGSGFSGTASAGSTAGTAFDLTGATGNTRGGFYGPNAAETAGVFSLTGGPKETTMSGSFGAKQAASDLRLKQELTAVAELPNGLKLHSWRYLGGTRRFTGAIAQELLADARFAEAVLAGPDGLLRVDYGRLGYIPDDFAAMRAEGEAALAAYQRLHDRRQ